MGNERHKKEIKEIRNRRSVGALKRINKDDIKQKIN